MTHFMILMALLGWGSAGIFDKKAVQQSNSQAVFVAFHFYNVAVAAVLLCLLPAFYGVWHLPKQVLFWEGMNALAGTAAMLFYFYAMSRSQATWVIGITAGYPIVGQILAVPILGETFSMGAILAAVCVSIGVALIGKSAGEEQRGLARKDKLLLIGALVTTTVLWGLLGIFEKQALTYGRPLESYLSLALWKSALAVVAFFLFPRKLIRPGLAQAATWKYCGLSALCIFLGNIGFIVALSVSSAGYVIVITACYPLVMYLFARMFLREPFQWVRGAGIGMIVFGAVLAEVAKSLF